MRARMISPPGLLPGLLAMAMLLIPARPSVAATPAAVTIIQSGQTFSETSIRISAGDRVSFLNRDEVNHNILVLRGGEDEDDADDEGIQRPNSAPLDVVFDRAGRFKVRCHIHPDMKLDVLVR